jgi:signal transduction histidine kinase
MVACSFFFSYTAEDIRADIVAYYAGAYASTGLLLSLSFIVTRKRKASPTASPNKYYLVLLLIVWICVGLSFGDMVLVEQSGKPASMMHLLSESAVVVLSVLVFFVFEHFQVQAAEKERTALVERQLLQEEQRFRLIDEQQKEVISLKHDLKSHMISVQSMLADAQYDEAIAYLDEYRGQTAILLSRSITGIPGIDALITEKATQAEGSGIKLDIKCEKLLEISISPYHFNIILSNALDNAIEACQKLDVDETPIIWLGLKSEGENLCIRVSNSSPAIDFTKGEFPATSKEDKLIHGLGLSTIKRVAEHYNGTMRCTYENGEFTLFVMCENSKRT